MDNKFCTLVATGLDAEAPIIDVPANSCVEPDSEALPFADHEEHRPGHHRRIQLAYVKFKRQFFQVRKSEKVGMKDPRDAHYALETEGTLKIST